MDLFVVRIVFGGTAAFGVLGGVMSIPIKLAHDQPTAVPVRNVRRPSWQQFLVY